MVANSLKKSQRRSNSTPPNQVRTLGVSAIEDIMHNMQHAQTLCVQHSTPGSARNRAVLVETRSHLVLPDDTVSYKLKLPQIHKEWMRVNTSYNEGLSLTVTLSAREPQSGIPHASHA
eukprot:6482839-Amphidinium_carterae.1